MTIRKAAFLVTVAIAAAATLTVGNGRMQFVQAQTRTAAQALPAPPKAALCGACHGAASGSNLVNTPSLAGQPRIFLENTLVLIREGTRDIPAMKGMLDGVSDEELIDLAKYYASLTLQPAAAIKKDDKLFARGKAVSDQTRCGTCHLQDFSGREQMPRLALQREDYLLHSMREFRANKAVGRDSNMAAALYGISDDDFKALAHYLAVGGG